jgi:hypothetical protein
MTRSESNKSTDRTRLVEKFVKDHPNITGKRTLSRMLVELYPDLFDNNVEKARLTIRYLTGSLGNRNRNAKKELPYVVIKENEVDYDETWHTPSKILTKSIGVIGDLHGQFMDASAVNTAVSILKNNGIKDLLINGDLIDNYYLSKFAKKAGRQKVLDEFNFCKAFLERIRPMFDNVYYKRGNHDEYVDRFFMNYPGMEGIVTLDERLTLTKLNIKEIHNLQEIKIGDLSVFHGHEKNGFFTPELVAKSFITWYQKYSGKLDVKIMFNHHHITDNYVMRNIDGTFAYGYGVGCLCKRLSYNPYPRWNTGIAEVSVDKGIASVNNFEI